MGDWNNWNPHRKSHKLALARLAKVIKSKKSDKPAVTHASAKASLINKSWNRYRAAWNRVRKDNATFLQQFKTPVHALNGKYTATVLATLDYVDMTEIPLERWLLCQMATCTGFVTPYQAYGENALDRYISWERRQDKKFIRKEDRLKQTDTRLEEIHESIIKGHVAALSWIPQLEKAQPPDLATGLFFLLPNIQGWYALAYKEFRETIMDSGLCDFTHMVKWYTDFKRSPKIQATCAKALARAQELFGPLEW